jgi:hypothetical protein
VQCDGRVSCRFSIVASLSNGFAFAANVTQRDGEILRLSFNGP